MTRPSWRQAPIAAPLPETPSPIRLGLGANWRQFALLVVVNAFVGAMVGLERTVVPLIPQADFGLVSKTVVLSFLVSFGLVQALANLLTGQLAAAHGLRPAPFYPGIAFAAVGLVLSAFAVRETRGHARAESSELGADAPRLGFARVFLLTSWRNRALFAASQAGMVNNLNDGMVWGLIPVFLAARGLALDRIGVVTAAYPLVWGIGQLGTGALSDRWGRKWMIAGGMWVQAAGIAAFVMGRSFASWMAGAMLLGIGTALVYPTLLAAVSDVAHPDWRASAVGVYRLWRDSGYATGALAAGLLSDAFTMPFAIGAIAALTFVSGVVVASAMYETLPDR